MTTEEKRIYLIKYLKEENPALRTLSLPPQPEQQEILLRSLMNVRPAKEISADFLAVQDSYLQDKLKEKKRSSIENMSSIQPRIYLWKGDITTLQVDSIVNAANDALLGCFIPCHACIDNAIHSASGVELRMECAQIMEKKQQPEPTGTVEITQAYNLPCKYVLHTVGPIVGNTLTKEDCRLLEKCYVSCLEKATEYNLTSLAFCCISTGEFHFPPEEAVQIAIQTVSKFLKERNSIIQVIFNVFTEKDNKIYQKLLGKN